MQTVLHRDGHQLMPGRVEFDLVDAVPEPVVGVQPGRLLLRAAGLVLHRRGTRQRAELGHLPGAPLGAVPAQCLQQGRLVRRAEPGQRRGLIHDFMGDGHGIDVTESEQSWEDCNAAGRHR